MESNEKKICLSTTGLTKIFGFGRTRTLAVDNVNMNLYEGEVVSIVGESGSGKTTLAKILLGLINDLLDQAQMEAGKLTIQMSAVKPAELLENLHGLLDKSASDKGLRLTSEIEDSLPETLSGDAARLQTKRTAVQLAARPVDVSHSNEKSNGETGERRHGPGVTAD